MAMELAFEPREGYLLVTISGQFELAEAQAATARVGEGAVGAPSKLAQKNLPR